MIFDAERIGLVFRMVQDAPPRKEPAVVVERLGFDDIFDPPSSGSRRSRAWEP
jgi:hypothetical protein